MDTVRVLGPLVRRRISTQVLSLVPEFGRIPVGSLNAFDIDWLSRRHPRGAQGLWHRPLQARPRRQPESTCGVASPGFWQLQLWGFFHAPKKRWREQLKATAQSERQRDPASQGREADSLEAAAAYGVKRHFRASRLLPESEPGSRGSGECWNTRGRILRGDAWVELMLFLDRIGLQRRILLSAMNLSVPPLQSRNDPRLGGSK